MLSSPGPAVKSAVFIVAARFELEGGRSGISISGILIVEAARFEADPLAAGGGGGIATGCPLMSEPSRDGIGDGDFAGLGDGIGETRMGDIGGELGRCPAGEASRFGLGLWMKLEAGAIVTILSLD